MRGNLALCLPRWAYHNVRARKNRILEISHARPISTETTDEQRAQTYSEPPRFHNHRLSRRWQPTGGITAKELQDGDATSWLIKAGYVRQAHSGVFHFLPAGLEILRSIESAVKLFLERNLAASELSLSILSTEALWRKSGRIPDGPLENGAHQFLTVRDRRQSGYILSPTHEEEITALVAGTINSYKDLPLRLFQSNRKYRDELRPRHGLLRTKEFIMKDLYTFDLTEQAALKTYDAVRHTYREIFNHLQIPVVEAKASSGDMGGSLSHEYHILSELGEDLLHICQSCGFAENSEVSAKPESQELSEYGCPTCNNNAMTEHSAIEVGHTFHLGDRYSLPLKAAIAVREHILLGVDPEPNTPRSQRLVPLQMGCHGIGISRLMGAVAATRSDEQGLRWPLPMLPRIAIIVEGDGSTCPALDHIMDLMFHFYMPNNRLQSAELVLAPFLDDRRKPIGWKLKDADLAGYPITLVLGKSWLEQGLFDIRSRNHPQLSEVTRNCADTMNRILSAETSMLQDRGSWQLKPDARTMLKRILLAQQELLKDRDDRRWATTMLAWPPEVCADLFHLQTILEAESPSQNPLIRKLVIPNHTTFDATFSRVRAKEKVRAKSSKKLFEANSAGHDSATTDDTWLPPISDPVPSPTPGRAQKAELTARRAPKSLSNTSSPSEGSPLNASPREVLLERVRALERLMALQKEEESSKEQGSQ